jgi:hypothetical protein
MQSAGPMSHPSFKSSAWATHTDRPERPAGGCDPASSSIFAISGNEFESTWSIARRPSQSRACTPAWAHKSLLTTFGQPVLTAFIKAVRPSSLSAFTSASAPQECPCHSRRSGKIFDSNAVRKALCAATSTRLRTIEQPAAMTSAVALSVAPEFSTPFANGASHVIYKYVRCPSTS